MARKMLRRDWTPNHRPLVRELYDFSYDPAVWQYVSLSLTTALDIAKGFPEYWTLEFKASSSSITLEEAEILAEKHRAETLVSLAHRDFPFPDIFGRGKSRNPNRPIKKYDLFISTVIVESTKKGRGPFYNNPFALRLEGTDGVDFQTGKAVICLDAWKRCVYAFHYAVTVANLGTFCDEFLPQIGNHGKEPFGKINPPP